MKRPVYPIAPSFFNDGKIDIDSTVRYISYLGQDSTIMTTAGTSQFNLLTSEEIRELNDAVIENSVQIPIIGIPALSLAESLKELEYYNTKKCYPMFLYPDRFYSESNVCEFFETLADNANKIYIHGMWMRKGTGGSWDYTSSVINRLAQHENIKGMKEETSDIGLAYKILTKTTRDFDIIVAGGSMRRHHFLSVANPSISFLTGVGSVYPQIAKDYFDKPKPIIDNFENPLFDVFMEIGWHPALRHALKVKGFIKEDRKPFIQISQDEKLRIESIMTKLESKQKIAIEE